MSSIWKKYEALLSDDLTAPDAHGLTAISRTETKQNSLIWVETETSSNLHYCGDRVASLRLAKSSTWLSLIPELPDDGWHGVNFPDRQTGKDILEQWATEILLGIEA